MRNKKIGLIYVTNNYENRRFFPYQSIRPAFLSFQQWKSWQISDVYPDVYFYRCQILHVWNAIFNELYAMNVARNIRFVRGEEKKEKERIVEKISPRISPFFFDRLSTLEEKGSGSQRGKGDTLVNDAATLCDRYVLLFSSDWFFVVGRCGHRGNQWSEASGGRRRAKPSQAGRVRRYGRSCSRSRVTRHHALTAGACLLQPFSVVSASLLPLIPPRLRARPERSTLASASLSGRPRASFGSLGGSRPREVGKRNRATRQPSPLLSSCSRLRQPSMYSVTSLSLSLFLCRYYTSLPEKKNIIVLISLGYFFFLLSFLLSLHCFETRALLKFVKI